MKINYVEDVLHKVSPEQSKNLNLNENLKLNETIIANRKATKKHSLLLVDDLYETGATINKCVEVLRKDSLLEKIYVLVMTKTKS